MKKAGIYITIFAVTCIFLGATAGMAFERKSGSGHYGSFMEDGQSRSSCMGIRSRERMSQEERCQRLLGKLAEELGLSAEQTSKLEAVLEQSREDIKKARDQFRETMKRAREQNQTRIMGLLTPEQTEIYQGMMAQHKERHKQRMPRRRHNGSEECPAEN